MSLLESGLIAAARGSIRVSAKDAHHVFGGGKTMEELSNTKDPIPYIYLAQGALWSELPADALSLANKAWKLVEDKRDERLFITTARLQGTAYLGLNDVRNAEERLQVALERVRRVAWAEEEASTLIYLGELSRRQGDLRTAEIANQGGQN